MGKYSWYGIDARDVKIGTRVARPNAPNTIGIVMGLDPEENVIGYFTKLRILWLTGKNRGNVHLLESGRLFNFTAYRKDYEESFLKVTTSNNEAEKFLKTLPNLQHLQGVENGEEQ